PRLLRAREGRAARAARGRGARQPCRARGRDHGRPHVRTLGRPAIRDLLPRRDGVADGSAARPQRAGSAPAPIANAQGADLAAPTKEAVRASPVRPSNTLPRRRRPQRLDHNCIYTATTSVLAPTRKDVL